MRLIEVGDDGLIIVLEYSHLLEGDGGDYCITPVGTHVLGEIGLERGD